MITRLLPCLLVAALVVGSCGDDAPETDAGPGTDDVTDAPDAAGDRSSTTRDGTSTTAETAADDVDVPSFLDFSLEGVEGGEVDGASFAGEDLVVWFWSPWCTKCNANAPAVAEAAAERDDVTFLGMAGLDGKDAAAEFVARHGLGAFPHAYDENGDTWQAFGLTSQASFAFVDDDGSYETVSYVTLDGDELNERIDALVAR